MNRYRLVPMFVVAAWLSGGVALAHHGDAGRYEEDISTLEGTVVALRLINPHSMIILDVQDDSGKVVRWTAELGGPAVLARSFGWDRDTLKPGDKVTLTGRRIKSGAPYFNLTESAKIVMTETGEEIYRTGVQYGTAPQEAETAQRSSQ